MSEVVIPAAAVAAAADVFERLVGIRDTYAVQAILEAATPHIEEAMLEAGWHEPEKPYIDNRDMA